MLLSIEPMKFLPVGGGEGKDWDQDFVYCKGVFPWAWADCESVAVECRVLVHSNVIAGHGEMQ